MMPASILILDVRDSVGVALRPLKAGEACDGTGAPEGLHAREDIPFGHKIALMDLPQDAPVRKYGEIIGFALTKIPAGSHIHTHNLRAPVG